MTNKPCFLAEARWLKLLRGAILHDESLADHADLILPLWEHLVGGPSQFKRTTDLLYSPETPSQADIEDLIDCFREARGHLLGWLTMAQHRIRLSDLDVGGQSWSDVAVIPLLDEDASSDVTAGDGLHLVLRGTYATCRLLKGRLLTALAPARFRHLEAESQELAGRIMALGSCGYRQNGECASLVGSLFMSQGSWIAQSVIATKDAWANAIPAQGGMIGRTKFEAWCRAMGRIQPHDEGA